MKVLLIFSKEKKPVVVSVIILNYNGQRYLPKLFSSLKKQSFSTFEIIFVDNASSDDSVHLVRKLSKKMPVDIAIKIIINPKNFGYCKGNNIGASMVHKDSKYLVFLNNDTFVNRDWLLNLVNVAKKGENVGVIGSKIVSLGTPIMALTCDFYGQTDYLVPLNAIKTEVFDVTKNFFYCSGASLFVFRQAFIDVGGFDEDFFMYHDEVDLCWRIRLSGYNILVAPLSICYHLSDPFIVGLKMPVRKYYYGVARNRLSVLLKNYSVSSLLKFYPLTIFLIVFRGLLFSLFNKNVHFLLVTIKGLLWNIKNFGKTLSKRKQVQRHRRVNDSIILSYMLHHSIEVLYLKSILLHRNSKYFVLSQKISN